MTSRGFICSRPYPFYVAHQKVPESMFPAEVKQTARSMCTPHWELSTCPMFPVTSSYITLYSLCFPSIFDLFLELFRLSTRS